MIVTVELNSREQGMLKEGLHRYADAIADMARQLRDDAHRPHVTDDDRNITTRAATRQLNVLDELESLKAKVSGFGAPPATEGETD